MRDFEKNLNIDDNDDSDHRDVQDKDDENETRKWGWRHDNNDETNSNGWLLIQTGDSDLFLLSWISRKCLQICKHIIRKRVS